MEMTDVEIATSYGEARNKKNQVKVLAELNACSKEKIIEILVQSGVPEEEFEAKKPGRKPGNREAKKVAGEKIAENGSICRGREDLADMIETPKLSPEEEKQVDRALAIPEPVRIICIERVSILTDKIIELEKERDCLQDFLMGVVRDV